MMRKLLAVVSLLGVAGCADPRLTRRFCRAEEGGVLSGNASAVEVSVFVIDPGGADARATLTSLSDRGQAALVEAVAAKAPSAPDLLAALGGRLGTSASVGAEEDRTRVSRRLVLSAARRGKWENNPADRIQLLRYSITNLTGGATFSSWNRFTTEYATVDLGKLSLAQSVAGSVALSAGPGAGAPVPVSGTASVTASRNLTEEVSLRQRYVNLTGILKPSEATLVQEGVVGIDLAGNAAIDVQIQVPACEHRARVTRLGALRKDGKAIPQDAVQIADRWIRFPKSPADVTFDYSASYRLRSVTKHAETIVEGDDKVRWISGETEKALAVPLVAKDDLGPLYAWYLSRDGDGLGLEGKGDLQFGSYEEIDALLDWLRESASVQAEPLRMGGRRLLVGGRPLRKGEVAHLRFDRDTLPCETRP